MNNAKNEGSDASRLALALLKGTAVGIGAAAVLMPILALAAYSSTDPSKLTVYLGYAAAAGKRKPKKRAKHSSPKKAPRRRSR